jgi:hypothetical protein
MNQLVSPREWRRVGRGHELQFFATDEEVQSYLQSALPVQHGPYILVGVDRLPSDVRELQSREYSIDRLAQCAEMGPHQLWIWPRGVLAALGPFELAVSEAALALSGLVLLQHGFSRHGKREASRIAVVDKIQSVATGEVIRHDAALQIFGALKAAVKRDLAFASIQTFVDGHEEEDSKLQLMTRAAADKSLSGYYSRRAGRAIDRAHK